MQQFSYRYADFNDAKVSSFALLCRYRGALWGMLAGAPIGVATMLNLSTNDPVLMLSGVITLWMAGGLCGHNMQSLLEGTR